MILNTISSRSAGQHEAVVSARSRRRTSTLVGISQHPLYGAQPEALKAQVEGAPHRPRRTKAKHEHIPRDATFDKRLDGFSRSNPL